MNAYEDALAATTTEKAPWYVVPADNKWITRNQHLRSDREKLPRCRGHGPRLPGHSRPLTVHAGDPGRRGIRNVDLHVAATSDYDRSLFCCDRAQINVPKAGSDSLHILGDSLRLRVARTGDIHRAAAQDFGTRVPGDVIFEVAADPIARPMSGRRLLSKFFKCKAFDASWTRTCVGS
jgi:hypothetical protein